MMLAPSTNLASRKGLKIALFLSVLLCMMLNILGSVWYGKLSLISPETTTPQSKGNQFHDSTETTATTTDKDENALEWHWRIYNTNHNQKRVLIAQQSGNVAYYRNLLDLTQRVNRAFARKNHYDYVALTGLALGGYETYHANFNKITVLREAMDYGYDAVLLLDADALVKDIDFDFDKAVEYNEQFAVAAATLQKSNHTWQFCAGHLLWNLKHPKAERIIKQWELFARLSIIFDLQSVSERFLGDQSFLNAVVWLHNSQRQPVTDTRPGVLSYIKHVMRSNPHGSDQWKIPNTTVSVDTRTATIQKLVEDLCKRKNGAYCEGIPTTL